MENEEPRGRAIRTLKRLQQELKREQKIRPGFQWNTSAIHAKAFNEALIVLHEELGDSWVHVHFYGNEKITKKSKAKGGNPPVDAVARDYLLQDVEEALRKVGADT